ncbi:hypothetical protein PSTT_15554 [Puccinia striiformis]|uniref:Uncharacterized protein n=1 Tax=Puccinia striiformis TaxID=27350 RepID=A0A2S4UH33_9BASI|nr:hypothetical protein PSTT_15554 [Puccinia striiformis]
MGPHYACPHLPTCGDIKYNKKPCREHSCLNLTQVKFHTLNPKIHRYCGPGCPAYALDVEEFAFQIYASDSSAILATNEKAIRNIGAKSVIHHRSAKRTEGNKRNLSSRLDQQSLKLDRNSSGSPNRAENNSIWDISWNLVAKPVPLNSGPSQSKVRIFVPMNDVKGNAGSSPSFAATARERLYILKTIFMKGLVQRSRRFSNSEKL